MPTNDFLPWATAGGANVLSQADYASDPARLAGVVAGLGRSILANKSWRQSASVAAAFGQFINDYGALDALDDGNIANLVRDFARSIRGAPWAFVTATGTANAWVVTPTPTLAAYASGRPLNIVAPATNTSTTVTMNVSGLGNRPVKKANGSDPVPGDFVAGVAYPTIDDGTSIRIITLLPSDLAAQKSYFNVSRTVFNSRVSLSGTGMVAYQSGTYTKKSSTSQLVIDVSANMFSTAAFASSFGRLTGLPTNLEWIVRNGDGSTSSPASTGSKIYAGVAAGVVNWSWSFGRNDASSWTSIVNPRSPTDAAFLPTETTSFITLSELEP